MADAHKNFAYSTVTVAPSPATSGTSLTVGTDQGVLFPDAPFNATIWPTGAQPTSANAEVVRVTAIADDTFTIVRAQEGSAARTVIIGDQIAATVTAKTLTDAEAPLAQWAPYILASSTYGLQTLASASGQSSTGSLFLFPVTIPGSLAFNQILLANSLTFVSSTSTVSNSFYSKFGIYSMNANTLSLISSNSFSIGETVRSVSFTWNYPTSTATSGYAYGSFPSGNLTGSAQFISFVANTRLVGLQFGGNMTLTGGVYWIGILNQKSTGGVSTFGFSHAGIIGHVIQSPNQVGSVSGVVPIGIANSGWTASSTHVTGWWGRQIVGFATATTVANFGGSVIPPSVALSQLDGSANAATATILPIVTFVST